MSIKVYDVSGRLVRTLLDEIRDAGIYADVTWDGRSNAGHPVASGVYFYRLVTKDFTRAMKMVMIK